MREFEFHVPTKILFGPGAEEKTGAAAAAEGAGRVLVLYGGGSAVRGGLVDRVKLSLAQAGIDCAVKGGVRPNPVLEFALETVREYRDQGIGLVLAVGGGSVMDTAKAVAAGLASSAAGMEEAFRGRAPLGAALGAVSYTHLRAHET